MRTRSSQHFITIFFSPSSLFTSLSHWSLNPCAQQVVYCLSKHLLLLPNIPFQPSLNIWLLLPCLSINQPRTELHCSPFSLTSAYFSPVAFMQSTAFQNNLVAPIFCSSNKHGAPTEPYWETSDFTTGLKFAPFQKHQLLHNWKLKLLTSLGLFCLQSEINCCCKGIIPEILLSAHSSTWTEKKKIMQCYKLKICGKGRNNKSETFASENISCNSNSSRIYKTEKLSSVSPNFSLHFMFFTPTSRPPPNSQSTWQRAGECRWARRAWISLQQSRPPPPGADRKGGLRLQTTHGSPPRKGQIALGLKRDTVTLVGKIICNLRKRNLG